MIRLEFHGCDERVRLHYKGIIEKLLDKKTKFLAKQEDLVTTFPEGKNSDFPVALLIVNATDEDIEKILGTSVDGKIHMSLIKIPFFFAED